jgi:hypothetical protein
VTRVHKLHFAGWYEIILVDIYAAFSPVKRAISVERQESELKTSRKLRDQTVFDLFGDGLEMVTSRMDEHRFDEASQCVTERLQNDEHAHPDLYWLRGLVFMEAGRANPDIATSIEYYQKARHDFGLTVEHDHDMFLRSGVKLDRSYSATGYWPQTKWAVRGYIELLQSCNDQTRFEKLIRTLGALGPEAKEAVNALEAAWPKVLDFWTSRFYAMPYNPVADRLSKLLQQALNAAGAPAPLSQEQVDAHDSPEQETIREVQHQICRYEVVRYPDNECKSLKHADLNSEALLSETDLLERMQDADDGIRVRAACFLATNATTTPEGFAALLRMLSLKQQIFRGAAIRGLGRCVIDVNHEAFDSREVLRSLTQCGRNDRAQGVRVEAIEALRNWVTVRGFNEPTNGELGQEVLMMLLHVLKSDRSNNARLAAAIALESWGRFHGFGNQMEWVVDQLKEAFGTTLDLRRKSKGRYPPKQMHQIITTIIRIVTAIGTKAQRLLPLVDNYIPAGWDDSPQYAFLKSNAILHLKADDSEVVEREWHKLVDYSRSECEWTNTSLGGVKTLGDVAVNSTKVLADAPVELNRRLDVLVERLWMGELRGIRIAAAESLTRLDENTATIAGAFELLNDQL